MSSLREEKKLWKKGYKRVVGLDEVGRGPLAGPVVAAAVILKNPKSEIRNPKPRRKASFLRGRQILNSKFKCSKRVLNFGHLDFDIVLNFVLRQSPALFQKGGAGRPRPFSMGGGRIPNLELRDSKKLSSKQREKFYKLITKSSVIEWGLGRVSEKVIDKINILEATKLAMVKAIKNLEKKLGKQKYHIFYDRRKCSIIDFLVLDGNFKLNLPLSQKSIVKADEKVFSCACASILAKVWRDKIMERYHKKYPKYRFDLHKGYGTKLHLEMLKKYGRCAIHRKSFNYGCTKMEKNQWKKESEKGAYFS